MVENTAQSQLQPQLYRHWQFNEIHFITFMQAQLPEEIHSEFQIFVQEIWQQAVHCVVNLLLVEHIPSNWVQLLALTARQVQFQQKHFSLIGIGGQKNTALLASLQAQEMPPEVYKGTLEQQLLHIYHPTPASNKNFAQILVHAVMSTFYVQLGLLLNRGKMFMKEAAGAKPAGEISSCVQISTDEYVYGIILTFTKENYVKILRQWRNEPQLSPQDAPLDGLAELCNIILGTCKRFFRNGNKAKLIIPQVFQGEKYPLSKVFLQDKEYSLFGEGKCFVIPFQNSVCEFQIEMWIPEMYASSFING